MGEAGAACNVTVRGKAELRLGHHSSRRSFKVSAKMGIEWGLIGQSHDQI